MKVLIELHYLPSIAYFSCLAGKREVIIEKHERFVKQTFRNRCQINTEHGRDTLIVPLTNRHNHSLTTDIRIDYQQKWLMNHWRTIQSAYGKAPFFEFYADDLEKVLTRRYDFLYDLNFNLLTLCLKFMKWDVTIKESLSYEEHVGEEIIDRRSFITHKKPANLDKVFKPVSYLQVFGNAFVDNLSLIDLIFCKGPEAGRIVQASSWEVNNS